MLDTSAIRDAELKEHVENFLDIFQQGVFPYLLPDGQGGYKRVTIDGQRVMQGLQRRLQGYRESGMMAAVQQAGLLKSGKYTIDSHNRNPIPGSAANNAIAYGFKIEDRNYPMAVSLGVPYLKGAKYKAEGGLHPVSVGGVLVNELAHIWLNTEDDVKSNDIERIVTTRMGAVPRGLDNRDIVYVPNSNGGFHTLYQNVELISPERARDLGL